MAVVAEIEVDRGSGMVRVPHAVAAVDAGLIINPDGLTSQIEGGIVQSVSWTLKEHVRFDQSGILTRDWASYPILTMPEAPKVEVELLWPASTSWAKEHRTRTSCSAAGSSSAHATRRRRSRSRAAAPILRMAG